MSGFRCRLDFVFDEHQKSFDPIVRYSLNAPRLDIAYTVDVRSIPSHEFGLNCLFGRARKIHLTLNPSDGSSWLSSHGFWFCHRDLTVLGMRRVEGIGRW